MSSTQKHFLKINPYLDIISGITVVLSFSDGIIKIIGREGSGKSVLCQLLATELIEEDQEVVIFSDIPHSEAELHDPIQQQLHLSLDENDDFYTALNLYIQGRPFDQQKLILVFDDADQIPDDCFDAIRILFEKNYHDRPEVSMVFAGSELLDEKLNEPANRTFNKNIILNFEVKPMNRSELEAFCNAYLVEMGLQKRVLTKDDLDEIFEKTQGLPGKIPQLIFDIHDREEESKKVEPQEQVEKRIIGKLVELDDDPEPELSGLSVEDREEALTAFKDQVPWRWQSNGVGIAVVVLFLVVAYGSFVPAQQRTDSFVIFPPPARSPGQLSREELLALVEQQALAAEAQNQLAESAIPAEATDETFPAEFAETAVVEEVSGEAEESGEPEVQLAAEPTIQSEQQPEEISEEAAIESAAEPSIDIETEITESETIASTETTDTNIDETDEPAVVTEPEESLDEESTPAQVAEAQTTPASPDSEPEAFVENWLQAWESQDLAGYFNAYHSAFTPAYAENLDAWQTQRTANITRPSNIDIAMESFEIINEDNEEATVRLQFTFESPTYADRTVKELTLSVENGDWAIREERNVSVEVIAVNNTGTTSTTDQIALEPVELQEGESGFAARIQQVLSLAEMNGSSQQTPFGTFINDWLGAWKNQDVEGYFRHYHDDFNPANFDSKSDWRADRIQKINEKRFIEIAFDDIEVLDEDTNTTRIRFWLSYASSFYLDRTLKEVVLSGANNSRNNFGILQERNLAVEIIPFYP